MNPVHEFRYESATCKLTISPGNNADLTHVYSKIRGQGHATALLTQVMEFVDKNDLQVYLTVRSYGSPIQTILSNEQLVRFYSKFGFVDQGYGPAINALMIRPRTKNTPYSERED